jgi:hypothetical protein
VCLKTNLSKQCKVLTVTFSLTFFKILVVFSPLRNCDTIFAKMGTKLIKNFSCILQPATALVHQVERSYLSYCTSHYTVKKVSDLLFLSRDATY